MARVWESFLTEDDKKVVANRKLRESTGPSANLALLVIDMQVTACGDEMPIWEQLDRYPGACGPHAWKAIPVQQRLLAAAREVGMPVIYSKHVFHAYTGLERSTGGVFAATDPRSEVPQEVAMQPGDLLVEKQTPSCFAFTNLPLILGELGVDGLIVVGNSTSGCVRATCVDGAGLGYSMNVVEEGVFDRIEMSHAAALFDMQFKICNVIDESDALNAIGAPAPALASAS
ncbi:isochorismatase family protein [Pseudooceanicola sp.]|uniref:cysteine hydrolase family protein n=1 Tax=Pseudooceanicola sp. TaxID=1914328 RepID=UPI002637A122|nr:isochorismatase family protein [Pseudooceanicola sp.]MDF1857029.1 isochorismatase family protein [Pseudooceanicola sp.]